MLKRRQVLLAVGASVSGLSLPALAQTVDSSLKRTPIENIKPELPEHSSGIFSF